MEEQYYKVTVSLKGYEYEIVKRAYALSLADTGSKASLALYCKDLLVSEAMQRLASRDAQSEVEE